MRRNTIVPRSEKARVLTGAYALFVFAVLQRKPERRRGRCNGGSGGRRVSVGRGGRGRRQEAIATDVHSRGTGTEAIVHVVVAQKLGRWRVRFGERGRKPIRFDGQSATAELRSGRQRRQTSRFVDHVHAATDGRQAVRVVGRRLRPRAVAGEPVTRKTTTVATRTATTITTAAAVAVAAAVVAQPEKTAKIAVVEPETGRRCHAGDQRQFGGQGGRQERVHRRRDGGRVR